ncbi:MAG: tetratricopeptide repeat protein [Myxococcaceae bacterium]
MIPKSFLVLSLFVSGSLLGLDLDPKGRLDQAWIRFSEQNYTETLVLLRPFQNSNNPEIRALMAHSEFELGNYLAAGNLFKTLSDQTSLYRMVQIEDHLNNFSELEKYYHKIKKPPAFVRYIYARQLLINAQTEKALQELEGLMAPSEYQEKAIYLKAVALKAQELFHSLFNSKNTELAQMARLSSARLYYEQDKPEKAIELYKMLNYPTELGLAQMRAGDLSQDLKQAQAYYQAAEANFTSPELLSEALLRQEKCDEARLLVQDEQKLIQIGSIERLRLRKRIAQIEQLKAAEEPLERISKYYDDALEPLKEKEKHEKELALRQLEKLPQKNSTVLLTLADLYFDFDLSKSIFFAKRLIKEYPNDKHVDAALYLLAVSYLYEGETENAEKAFQKFLEQHPKSQYADEVRFRLDDLEPLLENTSGVFYLKALYKSAWKNYLNNEYQAAIYQFAQLLDMRSGTTETLRKEAIRYLAISLMDGKQTPAQFAGKSWLRALWIQMGHVLAKADKNLEASKAFQEAILLEPKNPQNQALDLQILDLNPSPEVKKSFVARYLNNPETRETLRRVLLELATVESYALFIHRFPESENLDEVMFYYSEAAFEAGLFTYAATGFEQIRDWPWNTEYRERAALNAVYAYQKEMKQDFSVIELEHKNRFQAPIPKAMTNYVKAVDFLAEKFPNSTDLPGHLFQAAGIYYSYGNILETHKRFENLRTLYPKTQAARVAILEYAEQLYAQAKTAEEFNKAALLFEEFTTADAFLKAAEAYQLADKPQDSARVWREFAKRYKNKIAQADYLNLDSDFQHYQSLSINGKSSKEQSKQLMAKAQDLAKLQKSYEKIIKTYERSLWTLASIYQIGALYEDLFQALIKAPCPEDITQIDSDACEEYKSLLEDKAFVLEKKALDAYQLVIDKSDDLLGASEWILKAKAALSRIKEAAV